MFLCYDDLRQCIMASQIPVGHGVPDLFQHNVHTDRVLSLPETTVNEVTSKIFLISCKL